MEVSIRPLEQNDAHTSVKWRNIPELWVHTKFTATREITIQNELDWINKVTADPTSARFAIIVDDTYVGNIYLTDIKDGEGEYHIFIGEKDFWGKGIARKASVLIIDHGKNVLKLKTIRLGVKAENTGAHHLYESLGFKNTGEMDDGFTLMKLDLANWIGDPRDKMK